MIRLSHGNLLDAHAEAFVNTINEIEVMSKETAHIFAERFPENAHAYREASKAGEIRIGRMLVIENPGSMDPRWIINFPTKKHWRHPSKIEWVREGLQDLVRVVEEKKIHSIAIPALGCGNGGLEWSQVRHEIESGLEKLGDVDVLLFAPASEGHDTSKREGVNELTPAGALVAESVRRYSVLGIECTNLEVQKLAWFLSRAIARLHLDDPFQLRFIANRYGPYADHLGVLLSGLDGSYLYCKKRLSDAGPFDPIRFEESKRAEVQEYLQRQPAAEYLPAMAQTASIIDGFESPLGMELLATIDWLLSEGALPDLENIRLGLAAWPGGKAAARRKQKLFDDRLILLALDRFKATV